MILRRLGNYTSRQGVCWYSNQITIAKNLHITQSTVSRHIKKLIEWGYIRYAKKHPNLRGNKYFMVFDPKIKEEDALAYGSIKTDLMKINQKYMYNRKVGVKRIMHLEYITR